MMNLEGAKYFPACKRPNVYKSSPYVDDVVDTAAVGHELVYTIVIVFFITILFLRFFSGK